MKKWKKLPWVREGSNWIVPPHLINKQVTALFNLYSFVPRSTFLIYKENNAKKKNTRYKLYAYNNHVHDFTRLHSAKRAAEIIYNDR